MTPPPAPAVAEMVDLIARLEKAEGADRMLDERIHRATGLPEPYSCLERTVDGAPVGVGWNTPKRYTSSLDAALTLVPEGWRVIQADWSVPGRYRWMLKNDAPKTEIWTDASGEIQGGEDWHALAYGQTREIALCIAALKARPGGGEHG